MAFAATNISLSGRRNNAGADYRNNFAVIMQRQIIKDFQRICIFKDRHTMMTGTGSAVEIKSEGLISPQTRNDTDLGVPRPATAVTFGKTTINAEDEKYALKMIPDIQRLLETTNAGDADALAFDVADCLGRQWDTVVATNIMIGAKRSASVINSSFKTGANVVLPSGVTLTSATGAQLVKAFESMGGLFDEDDVPSMARYIAMVPTDYNKIPLAKSTTIENPVSKDFGGMASGNAASGMLKTIMGWDLLKTNSMVRKNITATDTEWGTTAAAANNWRNSLVSDQSKVLAVAWTPKAVATAMWKSPRAVLCMNTNDGKDAYLTRLGASFALAWTCYGVRPLRESCCGVITVP